MKFFKWFAGFFEDQAGTASSKRAALYVMLFFFYTIIKWVCVNDKPYPDMTVLYMVTGTILALIGVVGAEFFKQKPLQ